MKEFHIITFALFLDIQNPKSVIQRALTLLVRGDHVGLLNIGSMVRLYGLAAALLLKGGGRVVVAIAIQRPSSELVSLPYRYMCFEAYWFAPSLPFLLLCAL